MCDLSHTPRHAITYTKSLLIDINQLREGNHLSRPVFVFTLTLGYVDACPTYSPLARAGLVCPSVEWLSCFEYPWQSVGPPQTAHTLSVLLLSGH